MKSNNLLRPPGAVAEKEFQRRCIHCGQCAHICPWQSIKMISRPGANHNTPMVVPHKTPCWLCMKCPAVCPSGALDPKIKRMDDARMGNAIIMTEYCHNYTGVTMCWTCYDRCPLRGKAIVLKDGFIPEVTDQCVGCGVCEYVCPVQAIVVVPREDEE